MRWGFAVLVLSLIGALPAFPANPADPVELFVGDVILSTTKEWDAAFSAAGRNYAPPRLVLISPPRNHPARGNGYARGILLIDAGEIGDIKLLFPAEADALTAVVVAHEVAHHVQALQRAYQPNRPLPDMGPELQADCAAGWWLAQANARSEVETGHPRYRVADLEGQLPRLLWALDLLNYRFTVRSRGRGVDPHGAAGQRAAAIQRGAAGDLSTCGLIL